MVGGQHLQDRVVAELLGDEGSGCGNGRCRVARGRLQHDRREWQAKLACLFGGKEAEIFVGDDDCRLIERLVGNTRKRGLEQRLVADELYKLLGCRRP